MRELPFIDAHSVHVRAPVELTRDVVLTVARRLSARPAPHAFVALWHLEPPSGFAVASTPERVSLAGHHRFARYELAFEVRPVDGGGAEVCARTCAEFPGPAGRVYRALVIGSRGHGVAVRAMLRRIRRAAEARATSAGAHGKGERGDG